MVKVCVLLQTQEGYDIGVERQKSIDKSLFPGSLSKQIKNTLKRRKSAAQKIIDL